MIIRTGFAGLGASLMQAYESGQLTVNLNQPAVDLSNCDAATISAYNQGLIPVPICPAASGSSGNFSNFSSGSIPTWMWIALAFVGLLIIRR